MKSHLDSNSFVIFLPVALLLSSSCQTSTTESRAQLATDTTANQKSVKTSASRSNSEKDTEQRIKLLPVDEGSGDPSFQNFRNHLLVAVRKHDQDFILRVLHPAIKNGYDIEAGVHEFRQRWKPEDPESSIWDVLSSILTGGGSFIKRDGHREFCGPYVVSQWSNVVRQLPKGTDSLDYVAITGKDVGVRLEPKLTSPIVDSLSYDVVKSVPNSEVLARSTAEFSSWVKIKTPTGREGYVPDSYVQGPMDYGACFRRTNGRWIITELAARE
jgi:hypothetical protein